MNLAISYIIIQEYAFENVACKMAVILSRPNVLTMYFTDYYVLWASYQIRKIAGCACAGNAGNVFPTTVS